jgi:uncharacterized membrane protein (UPF0136 family)
MAKQNKKLLITISIIAIIVLVVGVGAYFYIQSNPKVIDGISIGKMFDVNGKLVRTGEQAVINGQQGVRYITLKVAVTNTDTVPLSFMITDASTSDFKSALTLNTAVTVQPGAQYTWESSQVDMYPYINKTATFSATIQATSPYRETTTKISTASISVGPDTASSFTVAITSSIQNGSTPLTCPSGQTLCSDNVCRSSCTTQCSTGQTLCSDGTCKTSCTTQQSGFESNAVVGQYSNYGGSDIWIKVDSNGDSVLEQYTKRGTVSSCLGTALSVTTPEGYTVSKYTGSSGVEFIICNPAGGSSYYFK